MARNWAEMGIEWSEEVVQRKGATIAGAQIMIVKDLAKFDAALRADGSNLTNVVNASSSVRVASQHTKRDGKGQDMRGEQLREQVYRDIAGLRAPATQVIVEKIVEKVVRQITLPNGKAFTGTDRMEYMQAFVAAMIEMKVPLPAAQAAAAAAATENGFTEAPKA